MIRLTSLLSCFVLCAASLPATAGPGLTGAPATPPAPAAPPPLYPRLRDAAGPVPGLAGYELAQVKDASRCGGIRIVTTRGHARLAADDRPIADVLAIEFPTGLDFSGAHKEASEKRFKTWLEQFQQTAKTAVDHYSAQANAGDAHAQLAAIARMVQIRFRMASVLARAAIPKDVRTGDLAKDKIDAYCETLNTVAAPLLDSAEQAAQACADKAAQLGVHGWWDQVCTPAP